MPIMMFPMLVESNFTCLCFENRFRPGWDYLREKVVSLGKVLVQVEGDFLEKHCNACTVMVSEAAFRKEICHPK